MRLEGLHHITMITADARRNVEFYADVLGLRLVKQTVNFDQPDAYHLYFGDEVGTPGSILTWFEFAGAARGRAGAGMIHRIDLRVGSEDSLDFWEERLGARGYESLREPHALRFVDCDGLAFALLAADDDGDPPLRAQHPEIPPEHAIAGIRGARAFVPSDQSAGEESAFLTQSLGFTFADGEYELSGARHFRWAYDPAPAGWGSQGAGSVHHIAWACRDEEQTRWRQRLHDAGRQVTDVIDRDYFKSIYFREPRHVLFEIATLLPGFAVDEDPDHLGEALRLPRQHEHLRARLERVLVPIENPRAVRSRQS